MTQEYADLQNETTQTQVNRRSRMETFCDILGVIRAGAEKPTHIMYKANLSWMVLQSYIKSLEDQGLIASTSNNGKRSYHLTEKGLTLLSQFNTLRESLNLGTEKIQTSGNPW